MERNRRPPDVEEALSSMLWTPYQRTPTDTSDEDDGDTSTDRTNQRFQKTGISIVSQNVYTPTIPYPSTFIPSYNQFYPKSFSSSNSQLPSYEHIEKERSYCTLSNAYNNRVPTNSNGLCVFPSYSEYSANMVHSFTDDFIQYQVIKWFFNIFLIIWLGFYVFTFRFCCSSHSHAMFACMNALWGQSLSVPLSK